jgi:hypothetical protein
MKTLFLIILAVLLPFGLALLLWLESKRKQQRAELDGGILDYSLIMRVSAVAGFLLCVFLDYVTLNGSQDRFIRHYGLLEAIIVFIGSFLVIPFSALYLFFETFFARITYSSTGIAIHSTWKRTRSLAWNDVQVLTFISSLTGSRMYLVDHEGHQVRINADFWGFSSFLIYAEHHLPQDVLTNAQGAFELAREYAQSKHSTV